MLVKQPAHIQDKKISKVMPAGWEMRSKIMALGLVTMVSSLTISLTEFVSRLKTLTYMTGIKVMKHGIQTDGEMKEGQVFGKRTMTYQ